MSSNPRLLYHISNQPHSELKTRAMLLKNSEDAEPWDDRISFLLSPPSKKDILNFVKAGFHRWDMSECYLHTVNVDDIDEYEYAKIESTPEQTQYDDKNWDKQMSGLNFDDDSFRVARKQYMEDRSAYLLKKGIPDKTTLDDIFSNPLFHNWAHRKWFEYNLKHGSTDQYATYVPHVQIKTFEPILCTNIIKLI